MEIQLTNHLTALNHGTYSETTVVTFENGVADIQVKGMQGNATLCLPEDGYEYNVEVICDNHPYGNGPEFDVFSYHPEEGFETSGQNGNSKQVKFGATVNTCNIRFHFQEFGDTGVIEWPYRLNFSFQGIIPKEPLKYSGTESGELVRVNGYSFERDWKDGDCIVVEGLPYCSLTYSVGSSSVMSRYGSSSEYEIIYGHNRGGLMNYVSGIWQSGPLSYYDMYLTVYRYPEQLNITKRNTSIGAEPDREYTFKIKAYTPSCMDENIKTIVVGEFPYKKVNLQNEEIGTGTIEFNEDGIAYIKLKDNEKVIIGTKYPRVTDVDGNSLEDDFRKEKIVEYVGYCFPAGTRFELEELDAENYDNSIEMNDVNQNCSFYVENSRKFTGKLIVNKDVKSDQDDLDEEFQFKIKLTDAATDLPTEYNYTGSKEGTLVFEDGIATFTLKANESITIEGLPVGATYEVIEESTGDTYTVTSENSEGTISEGTTSITFTNSSINEDEPKKETKEDSKIEKNKTEEETKKEEASYSIKTGDYIIVFAIILVVSFIPIVIISKRK